MYASVCMLYMICMILMGLLWSRVMIVDRSVRMRVLHQPLADLSIGCFEVSTSDVKASDTIPLTDNQLADEVHGLMIVLYCWTVVCCL